jgi:hypothetical protein
MKGGCHDGATEQGLGILLVLIILLDIFLTVLYARIGTSIIGSRVAQLIWASFVKASKVFGSRQGAVLSFCGPVILVLLVAVWALGLTLGAALIMHPELGTSIRATNGETPTDFITAMYAGGTSMAIVGASDFTPAHKPHAAALPVQLADWHVGDVADADLSDASLYSAPATQRAGHEHPFSLGVHR